MVITEDGMSYLGKVADWIKTCPDGQFEYGEYYVYKVEVRFDGDVIGTFTSDDPSWLFEVPKHE